MWTIILFYALDSRGEHHHTQSGADGLGWQVVAEVGTDGTSVSVSASNLAPHDTVLGTSALSGTVDESNTFSEVIASSIDVADSLQLQKRGVGVLVPLAPLESKMNCLSVESENTFKRLKKIYKERKNTSRAVPSWGSPSRPSWTPLQPSPLQPWQMGEQKPNGQSYHEQSS